MHTELKQTQTTQTPVERLGRAFAEACMKGVVDEALRRGWKVRLQANPDSFVAVIREEAVREVHWLCEQGHATVEMVDAGRIGKGYLDVTWKAAVGAVVGRTMKRMEA